MTRTLSQKDAEWLQGRGISETTTIRFGISTVQHGEIGSAIAIPFVKDGKTINHKYRGTGKNSAWMQAPKRPSGTSIV